MRTVRLALTLAFFASLPAAAHAQTQPSPAPSPSGSPSAVSDPCGSILSIVTRPTITTSVCTVRRRKFLIETGYTNTTTTGQGGGYTASYPQALARFGSGDSHFEYDIIPPSATINNFARTRMSGTTDFGFGVKSELGYNAKASWGANAFITLPSGSPGFTAGAAQYTGNLNWSYTVNQTIGLSGTLGFNSLAGLNANNQVKRFFSFIPSVVLSVYYPANSYFFAEYTHFSQAGVGLGGRSLFDYGFVHDIGPHLQLDVEAGVQPTTLNGQRLHYIGAGISFMN